jgi:Fe-S-cluster containining protein
MPNVYNSIEEMEFSELEIAFVNSAIRSYVKQLKDSQEPIKEKVGAMYRAIDEMNQDSFNKPGVQQPSCKKGCSHCCHIMVNATEWETQTLIEYMKHKAIEFDEYDIATLEAQAKIADTDEYLLSPHRRCVFLGSDNLCQVYEARPSACRNYFVFSDPEDCNTFGTNADGRVLSNFNLETVLPILALMKMSETDSLPRQLLKQIRKTNVNPNLNNAGVSNTPECQLHTGKQGQE